MSVIVYCIKYVKDSLNFSSISPTNNPTVNPTQYPTKDPTMGPTKSPSQNPTMGPAKPSSENANIPCVCCQ